MKLIEKLKSLASSRFLFLECVLESDSLLPEDRKKQEKETTENNRNSENEPFL